MKLNSKRKLNYENLVLSIEDVVITKKEYHRVRHEQWSIQRKINDGQKKHQLLKVLYESMAKEAGKKRTDLPEII